MTNYWIINILLSFTWISIEVVHCQDDVFSPPTVHLDRNWVVSDTSPVGYKITEVHGDGGAILFGLEPKYPEGPLPFRIDNISGIVYLNESLKGRAGQNMQLYVTAIRDNVLPIKTEVNVNIVNSSSSQNQFHHFPGGPGNRFRPPQFQPNIRNLSPKFSPNFSPPNFNYPRIPPIETIETKKETNTDSKTYLKPVEININVPKEDPSSTTGPIPTTTTAAAKSSKKKVILGGVENDNTLRLNQTVKSQPDVAATLVPILSVCAVFFIVGIFAVIFRKKIYLSKSKESKEDMRKESSNGIVLQEDPGLALQHWRGPRAFSNRYEPWDGDTNHPQASNQVSSSIKTTDRWEFPRHRLKFFNILGEGAFGQVWKCEAMDLDEKDMTTVVAVKTLKENANEKERSDLISELQVMKMLEPHQNVVRLLGCCTDKEPIFLIMEYVTKGKLQSYLRNSRAERYYNNMHGQSKSLTSRDLTSFVYQVAKGMDFLSANGIIHRDLAARNVLITDEHTCKVADFGFARDVIASHIYERKSEGRLPIRWMAPESLYDNIFSVKSDVWSFGIFMWEVVTLGSTPYPGLSAAEVMKKVRDGYRLDKPEHCRRELYNIMYYCWDKDPKQRPSFSECVELLEKLLLTETDYIELERFPDHSYYNMMSLSGEKL